MGDTMLTNRVELTVMVNVCGAEASLPPFAVPPLSVTITETVPTPNSAAAAAYGRVPSGRIRAGCAKSDGEPVGSRSADQTGCSRWTQAVASWVSSAAVERSSFRLICSR